MIYIYPYTTGTESNVNYKHREGEELFHGAFKNKCKFDSDVGRNRLENIGKDHREKEAILCIPVPCRKHATTTRGSFTYVRRYPLSVFQQKS